MLKDSLAKMPASVLSKTILSDEMIVVPGEVESIEEFYKTNSSLIESEDLTQEKSAYIGFATKKRKLPSIGSMIMNKQFKVQK